MEAGGKAIWQIIEFDHTDPYWIQMAKDKWEDMMKSKNILKFITQIPPL